MGCQPEMRTTSRLEALLGSQFFSYAEGELEQLARKTSQPGSYGTSHAVGFDWGFASAAAEDAFAGVCRIVGGVEEFEFLGVGGATRRLRQQQPLSQMGRRALLSELGSESDRENCFRLLLTVEAWLRVATSSEQTVAEYARTVMGISAADLPGALDALQISRVCAAIECLEEALSSPIDGLACRYNQMLPESRLSRLTQVDAASIMAEWRRFLREHLSDFREPYPAEAQLCDFWYGSEDEFAWVATLSEMDLRLAHFGPAFRFLAALQQKPTCA